MTNLKKKVSRKHSPVEKIRQSGLWLVQHLAAEPLREGDQRRLLEAIVATPVT
jgi:hypothetical protein